MAAWSSAEIAVVDGCKLCPGAGGATMAIKHVPAAKAKWRTDFWDIGISIGSLLAGEVGGALPTNHPARLEINFPDSRMSGARQAAAFQSLDTHSRICQLMPALIRG